MEWISSYYWIGWLALILVFIIIEMLSLELTFLMLAVGSVGGLVSGLLGAPWWLQLVIAAVLAVLLVTLLRPPLLRRLRRGGDPARSNVAALIGSDGTVVKAVTGRQGLVKLSNGETWTARLDESTGRHAELIPGQHVLVLAIDGATAVVIPGERSTQ